MASIVTRIEADGRLQIPAEMGDEVAPEHEVELVRCEQGILARPLSKTPLQTVLKRKLPMNRPTHLDLSALDMDKVGW
jgi:hypothetical protein